MRIRNRIAAFMALAIAMASCSDSGTLGPAMPDGPQTLTPATLPAVRISEFHYDNASTDVGETIEVSGPAGTNLTGYSLVLYNGNGGAVYDTEPLSGVIPATCGTRGVVVVSPGSIQNGSPDGIALVGPSGVIEFLSYEGPFIGVGGPADGMLSMDIGISQSGSEPIGSSLQRNGSGIWSSTLGTNTFGACNDDDDPVEVDHVIVTPSPATIVEGATQQFTATAYDADNQPVQVAFSWSSSAPAVASVDASGIATGVATGLAPGDTEIIATAPNDVAGSASLHVEEGPPPGLPAIRFSELHYDNAGTDTGEAIEVEGPAGASLADWSVVLYNGSGGAAYSTRALSGVIPNLCSGRGVVVLTYPTDGIQNGSPDGLALINSTGQVVEFLSYEGTFTATGLSPAAGMTSTNIVVTESSTTPAGHSLQRTVTGAWQAPKAATFGACNGTPPPPAASTISFSGRLASDPPLPVGFQDQLFATLRDGTGSVVATTFTWSSDTPALASMDQDGVMTALGVGNMVLRATASDADATTATYTLPSHVATASSTADYQGNAEFGEPGDGDALDDYLLRHAQYTSSWNPGRGIPNWVSFNLEASHFGSEDRCDCFTFDPALPAPYERYTTADYTGAGTFHGYGIDRGHLARSFDRTAGSLDNAFTYYFSNIIPQAADNNQGPWADLESYLGDLARFQNKELYVIAGAAGSKGTVKNEGLITIPEHVWKVVVIMSRDEGLDDVVDYQDLEVLAVIMPNDPGIRNVDWHTYETTVDAVEALSGYDLLALLPNAVEVAVENGTKEALDLIDQFVTDGKLSSGNAKALKAKLDAATGQLVKGHTTPALAQLQSVLNQLDELVSSGELSATDADALRVLVEGVIDTVSP